MTRKTTIYLPDDLKAAVERAAKRDGRSEAEIIRQAVAVAVGVPRPQAGILEADPFADQVDELLAGFGQG